MSRTTWSMEKSYVSVAQRGSSLSFVNDLGTLKVLKPSLVSRVHSEEKGFNTMVMGAMVEGYMLEGESEAVPGKDFNSFNSLD